MRSVRQVWELAIDLVFPQTCALCGRVTGEDALPWCSPCAGQVLAVTAADYCPRCALPVGPYLVDPKGCNHCRDRRFHLDGMARAGPYTGPIGSLVRQFKFKRRRELDRLLGELVAASVDRWEWRRRLDLLTPVPATWTSRLRYRGHPAELLARAVSRKLDGLPVHHLLRTKGKRRRQTRLNQADRVQNVRGVFHLHRGADVAGKTICVVDDVCTSGATLAEVARVLKRAGAAEVYAAVAARTFPSTLMTHAHGGTW